MNEKDDMMPLILQLGKTLLFIGLVLMMAGAIMVFSAKIPWMGRLPGDFYFKGKHFSLYFPLATGLLISVVLTLIFWLIGRK
ncbi:MAG: DUF2905 domain-containing protein [Syntrophales bacterium]|jgi:hypothetical protein|nr:DUF2905 domain-containing protein [Syntrophales bacterium]